MAYVENEAYDLQTRILRGELSEDELVALFTTLDRPLSLEEFQGFYRASMEVMTPVLTNLPCLDTCGTGGDGLNTFNISTAAAIVLAALGVPVAKHGNRSASGKCGSADVLEELGVAITLDALGVARSIESINFGFMFAPNFHPAFKQVASARKRFGKRTYFNLLGPLLNPAHAPYRVVGIPDPSLENIIGPTLLAGGVQRAWIVCGHDGMDEVSLTGKTSVWEYTLSGIRTFTITPEEFGFSCYSPGSLTGGDCAVNARIVRELFAGRGTEAQKGAVALNVAAGLVVTGHASDYASAVDKALAALTNPHLLQKTLAEIIQFA